MKKVLNLALFLIGIVLLVGAISLVDMDKTLELLLKMKFGFLAIIVVYYLITWLDTISWKYNFPPDIISVASNQRLWIVRTIGDAYNTIIPLGTLGGEPLKAHLLKVHHDISLKDTLSSLIITRTAFLAALIFFCTPGIFFIHFSPNIPDTFKTISLIGLVTFSIMIFLFFIFQITGTLGKIAKWFGSRISRDGLDSFLGKLVQLDEIFSTFYRRFPKRIFISILYAFVGWVFGLGEIYLIFYFLGYSPSFIDIWIIEAMGQLVKAGSFFIPYSLGALEGGLVLTFSSLGFPPSLGLAASLIGRIKLLAWVALGLVFGWILGYSNPNQKPEPQEISG